MPTPLNSRRKAGNTGMIMPKPIMSSSSVVKTSARPRLAVFGSIMMASAPWTAWVKAGARYKRVVADLLGGVQRFLDITLFEKALLRGEMRPHAGEAVGLQFDAHRHLVGFRLAHGLPHLIELGQDAGEVLDMVADLVRDHIGLG